MRIRGLPVEERLIFYRKAMELRRLGYGRRKIAKILGISSSTIGNWLYRGATPIRRPNYDLKPSPSLAYVIGALLGDGTIGYTCPKQGDKRYRYHILHKLRVNDLDFAKTFSEEVAKALGRPPPPISFIEDRRYCVEFASIELSKILGDMRLLKVYVDQFPEAFIRGLFDADGGVALNRSSMRKSHLVIANTNLQLLEYVQELLQRLGIQSRIRKMPDARLTKKPCYGLYIERKRSILLFAEKIGCSVGRKKRKLDELVNWILTRGNEKMWR